MAQVVRSSKVRHVYAHPEKKEAHFDEVRVTRVTWDSFFCSVNPKFLAVVTEAAGGGAFMVMPANKPGKMDKDYPLVAGHKAAVLDIQWCPFNDNIIASGSEDCTAKIWQIPDSGLTSNLIEPVVSLEMHERRVGLVQWHPTANNVLLTAGGDHLMVLWNVGTGEALLRIECHPDVIFSADFNFNGSRIVTTCKDKKIRVIDAHTGKVKEEGKGHEGSKPSRAIYLRDGSILSTGFSRMSERQYALRDETMIGEPIHSVEVDTSNGVLMPVYDGDLSMLYLVGKGDSAIRYFEINMEQPPYIHYINTYSSSEPQRGLGVMPKRGLDVPKCEVMRFYKLHGKGMIEPINMLCPRKSDLFQADLYPDTPGDIPALSAEEWFVEKKDKDPILISLKGGYKSKQGDKLQVQARKTNILDKMPNSRGGSAASGKLDANGGTANGGAGGGGDYVDAASFEKLKSDLSMLRKLIISQDKRIETLESKLGVSSSPGGGSASSADGHIANGGDHSPTPSATSATSGGGRQSATANGKAH